MSIVIDNTCLANIIGLDTNCGGVVPTSGIYASQVGITENFLSQIITSDFSGVLDFHRKKLDFAIDSVVNTIHTYLQPKYKAVSVVENFKTGIILENRVTINPSNTYKGIVFDLNSERSYLDFYLSSIELFVNYTGTIPVLVVDLLEGQILETINVSVVAGQIAEVYPFSSYASKKRRLQIYVCYDTTGIQAYKTVLKNTNCSSCSPSYRLRNSYENIQSATIPLTSNFMRSNVSMSNDTGGLSVTHSLNCNHRDWLCSISNMMVYPILYKYAEVVLEFALHEAPNERLNTTDTNNADLLQKRLESAQSKFAESMNGVLQNMKVPQDEKCFSCKESSRHAIVI
jgi:hypothetical protein